MDTMEEAGDVMLTSWRLMEQKNADYGDSWREMRLSSITDQILVKAKRIQQIEDAGGVSQVSEGVESEYRDILNYAVFALIKLQGKSKHDHN